MKDKGVCKGCIYRTNMNSNVSYYHTCNYMEIAGNSRLIAERDNGGYRNDMCVCYAPGESISSKRKPLKYSNKTTNT